MFEESSPRTAYLTVRLTPREHAFVKTEAERRGVSVGRFVRAVIGRSMDAGPSSTEQEPERVAV